MKRMNTKKPRLGARGDKITNELQVGLYFEVRVELVTLWVGKNVN